VEPVLLVRNDRYESFGVAASALTAADVEVLTVDATSGRSDLPPLEAISGVVTFGGTVNVDQVHAYPYLARVRAFTAEALERGVPYLGICLGSQILARAVGVEVAPGPVREVGFEPVRRDPAADDDPLLSFLEQDEMVLQWHEDTHELPPEAVRLVTGDAVAVQAYRIGQSAWGIQFHLEVDRWELEWWLGVADAAMDIEATWGKSAAAIRAEAERHMPRQEERGREIFRRFAEVARAAAR
jgi:GMP synthase-like glutamine amidotransferase